MGLFGGSRTSGNTGGGGRTSGNPSGGGGRTAGNPEARGRTGLFGGGRRAGNTSKAASSTLADSGMAAPWSSFGQQINALNRPGSSMWENAYATGAAAKRSKDLQEYYQSKEGQAELAGLAEEAAGIRKDATYGLRAGGGPKKPTKKTTKNLYEMNKARNTKKGTTTTTSSTTTTTPPTTTTPTPPTTTTTPTGPARIDAPVSVKSSTPITLPQPGGAPLSDEWLTDLMHSYEEVGRQLASRPWEPPAPAEYQTNEQLAAVLQPYAGQQPGTNPSQSGFYLPQELFSTPINSPVSLEDVLKYNIPLNKKGQEMLEVINSIKEGSKPAPPDWWTKQIEDERRATQDWINSPLPQTGETGPWSANNNGDPWTYQEKMMGLGKRYADPSTYGQTPQGLTDAGGQSIPGWMTSEFVKRPPEWYGQLLTEWQQAAPGAAKAAAFEKIKPYLPPGWNKPVTHISYAPTPEGIRLAEQQSQKDMAENKTLREQERAWSENLWKMQGTPTPPLSTTSEDDGWSKQYWDNWENETKKKDDAWDRKWAEEQKKWNPPEQQPPMKEPWEDWVNPMPSVVDETYWKRWEEANKQMGYTTTRKQVEDQAKKYQYQNRERLQREQAAWDALTPEQQKERNDAIEKAGRAEADITSYFTERAKSPPAQQVPSYTPPTPPPPQQPTFRPPQVMQPPTPPPLDTTGRPPLRVSLGAPPRSQILPGTPQQPTWRPPALGKTTVPSYQAPRPVAPQPAPQPTTATQRTAGTDALQRALQTKYGNNFTLTRR